MDAAVTRPPVLAGWTAGRAYAAFVLDPIRHGPRLHARYGSVFAIDPPLTRGRRGRRGVAVASEAYAARVLEHPEDFRTVGLSLARGPAGTAHRRLRDGVVRMNGPEQIAFRRAYAPGLSKQKICGHGAKLDAIAQAEIATWPRDRAFDAAPAVKRLVRRASAALLFGADDDPDALHIADLLERHAVLQYQRATFMFPFELPGAPFERLLRHAETTEATLIDWIRKRPAGGNDLSACIATMQDAAGAPLSEQARAAQLWTLYGASFETTATALCWALLHLAWNPEAAERLRVALAEEGPAASYLDGVVMETLRMTPPIPYQIRRATGDVELAELALTRGDRVFISALVMNRNPAIYHRSDAFLPERWRDTDSTAYRPLAFSAGPRRCLGFQFAMAVMKAGLAALWPQRHVSMPSEARVGTRIAITQGPASLPMMAVTQRQSYTAARFTGAAARQMSR